MCEPAAAVDLSEDVLCDGISCNAANHILARLNLSGQLCVTDAALRGNDARESEAVNGMEIDQVDMLKRRQLSFYQPLRYSCPLAKKGAAHRQDLVVHMQSWALDKSL